MEKNYRWKKINIFFIKICNYSSLGLHKGCLRYMRSLQPLKENVQQHFKTWNFLLFSVFMFHFLPSRIRIPNGSVVSTDLVEFGSNPDPKHFFSYIIGWMQVHVSLPGYEVQEVEDMVAFLYGRLRADSLPLALCQHLQLGCFRYLVSASTSSWGAVGILSLPAPPARVLQVSGLCQHLQLGCCRYLVSASTSSWGVSGIWSLPAPPAGVLQVSGHCQTSSWDALGISSLPAPPAGMH